VRTYGAKRTPLQVDGDGHFAGAVVAWRDISKRKLAEAKLIEAESRYREVVDAAREVVFQLDVTGAWQFLSPSWKEVTGYEVAEGVGRNYLEFVHLEDREATRAAAQSVLNQQRPSIRELTAFERRREDAMVEISASLSRDRGDTSREGLGRLTT